MKYRVSLIALVSLLCGASGPLPSGWAGSGLEADATHAISGFVVPAETSGLERTHLRPQDPSGASARYQGKGFPMVLTFIIYPASLLADPSLEAHFRAAVADVQAAHSEAKPLRSGRVEVQFISGPTFARIAEFSIPSGQGVPSTSLLFLLAYKDHIMKIRATFPESAGTVEAGWNQVQMLVDRSQELSKGR